jgi:hypothetical protein
MRRGRLAVASPIAAGCDSPAMAPQGMPPGGFPAPPIPDALDKAAAAAYEFSTARPAGPAAAPARAPGRG